MRFGVRLTVASMFLTGCVGDCQRMKAQVAGHTEVCVDGVSYLQFPTGTTPKVTLDGEAVACK